jgi:hypothetical protein
MGVPVERLSISAKPFVSTEDGEEYSVLALNVGGKALVLKEAKQYEAEVYSEFLRNAENGVPKLYATVDHWGKSYILMEYVDGECMTNCTRQSLVLALDSLIELQRTFWQKKEPAGFGYSFKKSLEERLERGRYLCDDELEAAYALYLQKYCSMPRTLCHDDLLPFNILANESKATIIDWEIAGILPYPTSLARLIAHCGEEESSFFKMGNSDREFAVWYYFDGLVKPMGISYDDFSSALDACLFYEYCEWVMLGNKYGATGSQRFKDYFKKAKRAAKKLK